MTRNKPFVPVYPALSRTYPADFKVDEQYRASLPDLQNGPASLIVTPGIRATVGELGVAGAGLGWPSSDPRTLVGGAPVPTRVRSLPAARCRRR